ncbi:MAG: MMPL family transporter, partial [Planctomycetaceae bacterium]|nr:MMPL family transporter [Planctomycetaceae bacterium]
MSDHPEDIAAVRQGTKGSSKKNGHLRLRKENNTDHGKSLLSRLMVAWAEQCLARPWLIVTIAVLTAVLAGVWTSGSLGYKVSRVDLLDPNSEYNKLWIDYIHEFGEDDDAVVVVEGVNRSATVAALEDLSQQLAQTSDLFYSILHEVDLTQIRAKGLHYVSPNDLASIDRFISRTEPVLAGGWSQLKVGTMVGGLAATVVSGQQSQMQHDEPPIQTLERYSESLLASLEAAERGRLNEILPEDYVSPWPSMPGSLSTLRDLSSQYLLAKEGKLGFVLLRLAKEEEGFAGASVATDTLRKEIEVVSKRHGDATIGLTGLPVMEDDEMRSSQQSMVWASGLSLAAVAIVIVAGFGGIRHALMANGVLIIGMAWAFAWATGSVGHLNILSVTFTVTMIGVGIDYGTYYIGRYLAMRREGLGCDAAIIETSRSVGPSIL